MALQESSIDGGVLISHQIHEGKHEYEVKSVIKNMSKEGEKFFLRRGDKLWQVNKTDLQDIPPEELAQRLSEGNPMLTVHKTIKKKEPIDQSSLDEDIMYPYSKEVIQLRFSMEMKREEDSADNQLLEEEEEEEEENICTEENEESDFLVVTMKKTSISVITGRSCDPKKPCYECHNNKCLINDIVMVTESSTIMLVPRGSGNFKLLKKNDALVENITTSLFIRSLCSQKRVYVSQNPEKITIYYYKSEEDHRGMPVVLNFTGSDCFLKCCEDGHRVLLQVEICDKQKLKKISKKDPFALSYVFYMRSERTKNTTFESALHTGWFIQVQGTDVEEMVKTEGPREENFFKIIIQSQKV